jgi:Anti-sigma-K factor rskA
VTEAGRHLRDCATCRDELASTAVGHALLSRTVRILGTEPAEPPALPPLEDLASAFPDKPSRPARHRGLRVLVAAAALVVATGLGAAGQSWLSGRDDARPVADRNATLEPISGTGTGTVSMHESDGRTSMTISTHDLPSAGKGRFYYAWLLDPTTNKMLPLGQVGPSGRASFEVSDGLLAAYSAVDVSLENDDGDPQHSPTSVLRASYA